MIATLPYSSLDEAVARGVHVVVNPQAGHAEPVLTPLDAVFASAGVSWDVSVVDDRASPEELALAAVDDGAGVVAAYGGDGTVAAVGSALAGTDVILGVLPGGTANAIARELGVPGDIEGAGRLFCPPGDDPAPGRVADVDLIRMADGGHALLQVGIGLHAAAIRETDREAKNAFGTAAYALAGLQAVRGAEPSRYTLYLDDEAVETTGVACLVCNGGAVGFGPFALAPEISMSDGLLDVLVLQDASASTLLAVTRDLLLNRAPTTDSVQRWRSTSVWVESDPPQPMQRDGSPMHWTPLVARVRPGALRVVVPDPLAAPTDL